MQQSRTVRKVAMPDGGINFVCVALLRKNLSLTLYTFGLRETHQRNFHYEWRTWKHKRWLVLLTAVECRGKRWLSLLPRSPRFTCTTQELRKHQRRFVLLSSHDKPNVYLSEPRLISNKTNRPLYFRKIIKFISSQIYCYFRKHSNECLTVWKIVDFMLTPYPRLSRASIKKFNPE